MPLSSKLRNDLVAALVSVPSTSSRSGRDALLVDLPPNIVAGLTRPDAQRTDLMLVVSQLEKLGRLLDTGERPLVILAQAALPEVEGTDTGRKLAEVTKALEEHYGRGEAQPPPPLAAPPPPTAPRAVPEAIIFGDDRVSYAFVERALAVASGVARLAAPMFVDGKWMHPELGTAWLVAPGLLLTNHHVVAWHFGEEGHSAAGRGHREWAPRAWFDYRQEGGERVEHRVEKLVCWSERLDYALLRLEGGVDRRPLSLVRKQPSLLAGDRLNIVQHPRGGPIRYAMRSNHYVGTAGQGKEHLLRYLTDTEGGSSGSPVLDDTWRVVALHHAWTEVPAQQHAGQVTYVNNEGIAIHTILEALPPAVRAEIEGAQGWRTDVAAA